MRARTIVIPVSVSLAVIIGGAGVAAADSYTIAPRILLPPKGLARPLLRSLSVLDPNGVRLEVIDTASVIKGVGTAAATDIAVLGGSPEQSHVEIRERDCRVALSNLARLSLVSVHPGSHAVTTEQISPDPPRRLVRAAADALLTVWPDIERHPRYTGTSVSPLPDASPGIR